MFKILHTAPVALLQTSKIAVSDVFYTNLLEYDYEEL